MVIPLLANQDLTPMLPLVFKNDLRIILGSKSEKFKNIEARKKVEECTMGTDLCREKSVPWEQICAVKRMCHGCSEPS